MCLVLSEVCLPVLDLRLEARGFPFQLKPYVSSLKPTQTVIGRKALILKGNLIANAFQRRKESNKEGRTREFRSFLGPLPAVPFEVVPP